MTQVYLRDDNCNIIECAQPNTEYWLVIRDARVNMRGAALLNVGRGVKVLAGIGGTEIPFKTVGAYYSALHKQYQNDPPTPIAPCPLQQYEVRFRVRTPLIMGSGLSYEIALMCALDFCELDFSTGDLSNVVGGQIPKCP